jgi:glycosyltransferase involved in cell wall biosynthesis
LSSAIVFVSKANQNYARRHHLGRPESYSLIRSGIKLSDFPTPLPERARKKTSLGLGIHKPLISSIGNLKPQKNPADFVSMAQKVNAELPETEFIFLGEGPLRTKIEAQVLLSGLTSRFSLPGWRRDVAEILALSEVFVLTSLWEGLPRALIEAMKSGVPPVCYATDGILDIVQDGVNGFLIPAGDVTGLARRVLELLKDEALRKKMGGEAAASIGEEFDIDLMVQSQERLYEKLL